jgi:hypothetical protein
MGDGSEFSNDDVLSPQTNGRLTTFMATNWPHVVVKKFTIGSKWYKTIFGYAVAQGVKVKKNKSHFKIKFAWDVVSFSNIKGRWKMVSVIRENVWFYVCDGEHETLVPNLSIKIIHDLIFMAEQRNERLVDLPSPVELVMVKDVVRGRKTEEKVWHFVDEPIRYK